MRYLINYDLISDINNRKYNTIDGFVYFKDKMTFEKYPDKT